MTTRDTPEAARLDALLPYLFDLPGCPARDGSGDCTCGRDEAVGFATNPVLTTHDTPEALAAVLKRHHDRGGFCGYCSSEQAFEPWPCDAARAREEIARLEGLLMVYRPVYEAVVAQRDNPMIAALLALSPRASHD